MKTVDQISDKIKTSQGAIRRAELEVAGLQAKKEGYLEELKKLGANSLDEAQKLLEKKEAEVETQRNEIEALEKDLDAIIGEGS